MVALAACASSRLEPGGDMGDGDGGFVDFDARFGEGGAADPQTCEEAAGTRSNVGCDYWPTVVANVVNSIFDFTVVVANSGASAADVDVTGPSGFHKTQHVDAGQLVKIYLPWVPELKGGDSDVCGLRAQPIFNATTRVNQGAYHLTSTRPVVVYQFNALEYKGEGGAAGKSWASCPTNAVCPTLGFALGCYSFTNDASLLLPTTALTGTYRITGQIGASSYNDPTYFAVTGTQNGTHVTVHLTNRAKVTAGGGIPVVDKGGVFSFDLDAGDVIEVVGLNEHSSEQFVPDWSSDFSGSLVTASKPVQVITGIPCIGNPPGASACDHIEESVMPAESLGRDYVVTVPTSPNGAPVSHTVRIYGNFDDTHLTYDPAPPADWNAPTTINAGDVIDLVDTMKTVNYVKTNFRVQGDKAFAVGTFQMSAAILDPTADWKSAHGDPAQSNATAVQQYRTRYVFLSPDDYDTSFVDVVAPHGTTVSIDGASPSVTPTAVGASGFDVLRVKLGAGNQGAHTLTASAPVGIQVMGYGSFTSYQYPGGSDLLAIAPTPVR
jgi:hypothetical protein